MTDASSTLSREHERQLIGRVRAGDTDAMRELIDAHKDRLFAFVWRMNRHHHDAEEICRRIHQGVDRHRGRATIEDDVTILALQRAG